VINKHVMTFLIVLVLAALAQAQTFTTLYSFTGGADGGQPVAGVIQDKAGNLYGTTEYGGSSSAGVVFELNTAGIETVLHSFTGGSDGGFPAAPLIRDGKGNLYGTTYYGGSSYLGTVFKIDAAGNETVLHSFAGGESDGCYPYQGLVRDKAGNLYGTTIECGSSGYGTVFKIDTAGKETILHSFTGGSSDGAYPFNGHLLVDTKGNLYGVTELGGSSGYGALYELGESRAFTVLHSFAWGTSDGCYPFGTVARDKAGNFYGTASQCGTYSFGTVWKVGQKDTETVLYNFTGRLDGCDPVAGPALDSKGNLYGVAAECLFGAVSELSKSGTMATVHIFDGPDGAYPYGELLRTAKGELFGTTYGRGWGDHCQAGCGTVWSFVP